MECSFKVPIRLASRSMTALPGQCPAGNRAALPIRAICAWNNGINREVFGGWQISGITTVQGGSPFTVYNNSTDFSGFNQLFDRPDVAGAGKLTQDNSSPDAAFDTAYFSKTPPTG